MRTRAYAAGVAALVALALTGCGAAPEKTPASASPTASEGSSTPTETAAFKACMVSDEGGFDDRSFNQSGWEGMEKAKSELKIEIGQAESHTDADFKSNIDNLLAQNCKLIIGVGFKLNDAIRDAANANPNTEFALIDSRITAADFSVLDIKNAKPLVFYTAEAAYLAGYAAASHSKTGKIGTFGGMQIPSVAIFMDGFADGIKKYNEDFGKSVQLLGWDKEAQNGSFVGNFSDQNKAKQLSEGLLSQGADILLPVAGPLGAAAVAAVKDQNKDSTVVWVDSDGYESTADGKYILTSIVKKIGQSVFDTIQAAAAGDFKNEAYVGTLANKGVALAPFHDFDDKISADVKAKLSELEKKIADGSLKIETKNQP